MGAGRLAWAAVALVLVLTTGGCSRSPVPEAGSPPATAPAEFPPMPDYPTYPVGVRRLDLHRGHSRPLPTLIFYPATPTGTAPAAGRFPLVLFSHGLSGSAERYSAAFAAAGFIVAAPTYPHTSEFTTDFRRADIVHQPADARYVLSRVLRLNYTRTDPLWHRIDAEHQAAIGHSAGGYTTTGLFTAGHDPRLRAGIVMAGWAAPGAFAGPPARMLFLQGTADPVVPRTVSHAAWERIPWPKAYMFLRHNSHATYLRPGDLGYDTMRVTVIDFLRWTLTGDESARRRLPRMVCSSGPADAQVSTAQWARCNGVP
ncbi:alpha/beta hydrolase family protein [Paractinoplanes durhamensis]|uniref:PET hydrolase/cutinase-like domain-containing protein n=1 Tax=Paractinoplanes durhamensis TaxID=113563 RepID=A0ABQ3YNS9_9ACTN|nr:hypothetical protein [Actinoplanes durhamensis]GID99239.1 hypothetical protein Adu01nite_05900 [Actinoplanes durhamensis]